MVCGADGAPVPGLVPAGRRETGDSRRRALSRPSGVFERTPGLLRDDKRSRARFAKRSVRKTWLKARLVPRYLTSRGFRLAFTSGVSANTVCFERDLLDRFRLVFEK